MVTAAEIQTEFNGLVQDIGEPVRIRYYTFTYSGADYDNAFLDQSGTDVWGSGIHQTVSAKFGTEDWKFLEEGRIQFNDVRFYINGSVDLTPASGLVKIGLGSPPRQEYFITDLGVNVWRIGSGVAHQRAFLRILNTGSFVQEI